MSAVQDTWLAQEPASARSVMQARSLLRDPRNALDVSLASMQEIPGQTSAKIVAMEDTHLLSTQLSAAAVLRAPSLLRGRLGARTVLLVSMLRERRESAMSAAQVGIEQIPRPACALAVMQARSLMRDRPGARTVRQARTLKRHS